MMDGMSSLISECIYRSDTKFNGHSGRVPEYVGKEERLIMYSKGHVG